MTDRARLLELLTARLGRAFEEALPRSPADVAADVLAHLAVAGAQAVVAVVVDEAVVDADIRGALPRLMARWEDVDREARHTSGLVDGEEWRGYIETLANEGDLAGAAAAGYACATALDRERARIEGYLRRARDELYALECRMDPGDLPQ